MVSVIDAREPDLRLIFPEGSYENALWDYQLAKEWILGHGLAFSKAYTGIINSPRYHGEQSPGVLSYDNGWMQKTEDPTGWQISVDFYASDELPNDTWKSAVVKRLKELHLPKAGCEWKERV